MEELRINKHKSNAKKFLIWSIVFLVLTILILVLVLHSMFSTRKHLVYVGTRSNFYSAWIILIPLIVTILFFILYKINKKLSNKE